MQVTKFIKVIYKSLPVFSSLSLSHDLRINFYFSCVIIIHHKNLYFLTICKFNINLQFKLFTFYLTTSTCVLLKQLISNIQIGGKKHIQSACRFEGLKSNNTIYFIIIYQYEIVGI